MELQAGPSPDDARRRDHAGVSLKTVSRSSTASPACARDRRARDAAIAALGFPRNDLARSLRHGRASSTLGLVIEDVANPFYSAIARRSRTPRATRGFMLITGSCDEDPDASASSSCALLRRRVDALLLVPAGADHRYLLPELGAGTPVVFLDRPPLGIDADTVLLDNAGGARAAVEHLLAHGHQRIACVADRRSCSPPPSASPATAPRCATPASTRRAPGAARLARRRSAERPSRALLELPADRRPTALFTANNRNTVGALRALRAATGTRRARRLRRLRARRPARRARHRRRATTRAELGRRRRARVRPAGRRRRPPQRRIDRCAELVPRGSGEVPRQTAAVVLPPNVLHHFYAGGGASPRSAAWTSPATTSPEDWLGATQHAFGEPRRGLTRLTDGTLVSDAIAADPEACLGAEHVARFGADPALLVKLLDAGERLPVHFHPGRAFAREHLGLRLRQDRGVAVPRGRRPGAAVHVGLKDPSRADTCPSWIDAQDADAMLAAIHELPVTPATPSSCPPARRTRSARASCWSSCRSRPTSRCCSSGTASASTDGPRAPRARLRRRPRRRPARCAWRRRARGPRSTPHRRRERPGRHVRRCPPAPIRTSGPGRSPPVTPPRSRCRPSFSVVVVTEGVGAPPVGPAPPAGRARRRVRGTACRRAADDHRWRRCPGGRPASSCARCPRSPIEREAP